MKKLTNFCFAGLILLGLSLAMCSEQPASKTETAVCDNLEASTPQQALAKLMAGNERYVAGTASIRAPAWTVWPRPHRIRHPLQAW